MMALGPFAFSSHLLVGALSLIGWLVIAQYYDKRYQLRLEPRLWWIVISSLIVGRMAFVITYIEQYRQNVWSILAIRDGGFSLTWAVATLISLVVFQVYRSPNYRRYWIRLSSASLGLTIGLILLSLWLFPRPQELNTEYLTLTDLEGKTVALQNYQGKPMVMNLWASWCAPCRREMPVLQQAQQQYPDIHFVLVNQGESRARIQQYLFEEDLDLANVLSDVDSTVLLALEGRALPTTLFLNGAGQIVATRVGELSQASLQSLLQRLQKNSH